MSGSTASGMMGGTMGRSRGGESRKDKQKGRSRGSQAAMRNKRAQIRPLVNYNSRENIQLTAEVN